MEEKTKIKVIAHRGWSAGKNENTLDAFKKAVAETGVGGVEFDVRWCTKRGCVIISHDLDTTGEALELESGLEFLSKENLELFIEMKECDKNLFCRTTELLDKYNLKQKTLIFGFRDVVVGFPWNNREGVKLGIISEYPWEILKDINNFRPDSILIGWDDRWWTKSVFKFVWTIFSLKNICEKYSNIDFVVGVAKSKEDYNWLCKQEGIYCLTADKPFEWEKEW